MEIIERLFNIIEIVGLAAFAVSGVIVAMQRKMDLMGIVVLAIVTAVGGGILRDVVLDRGIPVFFTDYTYIIVVLATIIITLAFNSFMKYAKKPLRLERLIDLADAVGLAAFCASSGVLSINMGGNLLTTVFTVTITGTGGGILRDMLAHRIPLIFRGELYATPCILSGIIMYYTYQPLGMEAAIWIALVFVIAVRCLGIFFGLGLPKIKNYMSPSGKEAYRRAVAKKQAMRDSSVGGEEK